MTKITTYNLTPIKVSLEDVKVGDTFIYSFDESFIYRKIGRQEGMNEESGAIRQFAFGTEVYLVDLEIRVSLRNEN